MKYIMLDTPFGARLPVLFSDMLTHCHVAGAMQLVVDCLDPKKDLRGKQLDGLLERGEAKPVSAGFVSVHDVAVHGESESLGGLKHGIADAARIEIGDTVAFMPDAIVDLARIRKGNRTADETAFCDAVWQALKGDHNDLLAANTDLVNRKRDADQRAKHHAERNAELVAMCNDLEQQLRAAANKTHRDNY